MKIKIALLEKDENYLKRLAMVFSSRYSDKLEIHSFTKKETAIKSLSQDKIDLLISSELFSVDETELPSRCILAYFVDSMDIDTVRGQKAICKFQKAELIYKQILNIYAERESSFTGKKFSENDVKSVFFTSFSGGVGCSSLAAAFAIRLALAHKKVMYLNLEKTGDAELFFQGEGRFNFSDIIYALKSKKANLSMKIESSVKISTEGVNFFAAPKVALDAMELKIEEIEVLLNEISNCGYEFIIIDAGFHFDGLSYMLWKKSNEVVIVSDGTEIANSKFNRAYQSLGIIQEQDESFRLDKADLVYNKFSNKICQVITGLEINDLGGIPRYEHALTKQVVEQISSMDFLDKIL